MPDPPAASHRWPRVELMLIPDCPNTQPARAALREAARLCGIPDLVPTVTVIDSVAHAERRGFVGSPTFLFDGIDPFAVGGSSPGLACRVYPTSAGPAGVPEVEQLRAAFGAQPR